MYDVIELANPRAAQFVAEKVEAIKPWGPLFLARRDLSLGKAVCLMPRDVRQEDLESHDLDFTPPGLALDIAQAETLRILQDRANPGTRYLVMAQDPASDPGVVDGPTALLGDALFHWRVADQEGIAAAAQDVLSRAEAWTVALALCSVSPEVVEAFESGKLSDEILPSVIASTDAIVVDAFDQVGYVLWESHPVNPR